MARRASENEEVPYIVMTELLRPGVKAFRSKHHSSNSVEEPSDEHPRKCVGIHRRPNPVSRNENHPTQTYIDHHIEPNRSLEPNQLVERPHRTDHKEYDQHIGSPRSIQEMHHGRDVGSDEQPVDRGMINTSEHVISAFSNIEEVVTGRSEKEHGETDTVEDEGRELRARLCK